MKPQNSGTSATFIAAMLGGSPAAAFMNGQQTTSVKRRIAGRRSLVQASDAQQAQKRHSFLSLFRGTKDRSPTADDEAASSASTLSLPSLSSPVFPPDRDWVPSPKPVLNEAVAVSVAFEVLMVEEFAQPLDFHEAFVLNPMWSLEKQRMQRERTLKEMRARREKSGAQTRSCREFGPGAWRSSLMIKSDKLRRGLSLPGFETRVPDGESSDEDRSECGTGSRRKGAGGAHPACQLHPHLSG